MNVWEITSDALKKAGFDVYPPGVKNGECKRKYIVLKQDGSSQIGSFSSRNDFYMIMLYVPKDKYHILSDFEAEVHKVLMENVFPILVPTGQKNTDYYDDNYKAHMRYIIYQNRVRDKYL